MRDSDETKRVERSDVRHELAHYDKEDLLAEYTELSEEVRYRDGLMHNSYYLIAIALVFLLGNIITWSDGSIQSIFQPGFIALFCIFGGLLSIVVSVVMKTYNEKRVRAEQRRADIEAALNQKLGVQESAQPVFAIQKFVLRNNLREHWTHGQPISSSDRVNIVIKHIADRRLGDYTALLFVMGLFSFVIGLIAFVASILPYALPIVEQGIEMVLQ